MSKGVTKFIKKQSTEKQYLYFHDGVRRSALLFLQHHTVRACNCQEVFVVIQRVTGDLTTVLLFVFHASIIRDLWKRFFYVRAVQ